MDQYYCFLKVMYVFHNEPYLCHGFSNLDLNLCFMILKIIACPCGKMNSVDLAPWSSQCELLLLCGIIVRASFQDCLSLCNVDS
jgi:hypothetical protein